MKLTRTTQLGYPRDDNGQPLCRLCRKPKSEWGKGRRTWCSQACVDRYNFATSSSYLRAAIFERDKGVCAGCTLDCDALLHRVQAVIRSGGRKDIVAVLREHGFDVPWIGTFSISRSLWDADHIEALDEGGSTDLENVQTLCQPCHKDKTAEQASRRGKQLRLLGKKWRNTQKLIDLTKGED